MSFLKHGCHCGFHGRGWRNKLEFEQFKATAVLNSVGCKHTFSVTEHGGIQFHGGFLGVGSASSHAVWGAENHVLRHHAEVDS